MATKARNLSRNHIKLSDWHIGFAIFYAVAATAAFVYLRASKAEIGPGVIFLPVLPLFHLALAWGSRVKSEAARQVSMLVGFAMFMAVPIGTIIALVFFLPLTDWEPAAVADAGDSGRQSR
jgi:hypothetical protein